MKGSLIEKWRSTAAGTIEVDWAAVEQELGFAVHENLKDFYSRVLGRNGCKHTAEGVIKFDPKAFVKENVSRKDWLADIDEVNGDQRKDDGIYPAHNAADGRILRFLPKRPGYFLGNINIENKRNNNQSPPASYPKQENEIK